MTAPLRTLLVGVGTRGKHWARIIRDEPLCTPVGYMDVSEDALAKIVEDFPIDGGQVFTSLESALANLELDLVILSTPPMVHLEQARLCFAAGHHVLAEKPLATNLPEAIEIVRLAETAGKTLTVGMNFRYQQATMEARKRFKDGSVGEPSFSQYVYWINRDGKRPGINKYPLTMHQPMLYEQSIHHLDQLRFAFDREVVRVSALTHNPPWSMYEDDATVVGLLTMEDDLFVDYFGTWSGTTTQRVFQWRTDCARGAVVQRKMFSDLAIIPADSDIPNPIPLPEQEDLVDDARGMFTHICTQILDGVAEPVPSGRDHLKTLALTAAMEESSKSHRVVEMSEFYEENNIPKEWI